MRAFRFGYQARANDPAQAMSSAQAAEAAGFDVFHTFDHVGPYASALTPLAAVGAVTTRIRLCPLVLNNDLHHPVTLAQDLATVDHLSGGRVEVGIGAGHAFPEYAAIGQPFDPPQVRKARLAESVQILRRLLDGEQVSYERGAAELAGITTSATPGRFGRHSATSRSSSACTAAPRSPALPFTALVQAVVVTDDRRGAAQDLAGKIEGLSVEDALATPFLALGTHDEIAAHLRACRDRWNISYYSRPRHRRLRARHRTAPRRRRTQLTAATPGHQGSGDAGPWVFRRPGRRLPRR